VDLTGLHQGHMDSPQSYVDKEVESILYRNKYIQLYIKMCNEVIRGPARNRSACPAGGTHTTAVSSTQRHS
jgi:hypothetical protein